jgi:hypothetical protein
MSDPDRLREIALWHIQQANNARKRIPTARKLRDFWNEVAQFHEDASGKLCRIADILEVEQDQ